MPAVCVAGVPLIISDTFTVAMNWPSTAGVNVTAIWQLELAASAAPQLLVCAKRDAPLPVRRMLVMGRLLVVLLLSVKFCADVVTFTVLTKLSRGGSSVTGAAVPLEAPYRLMVWVGSAPLSVSWSVSNSGLPATVGVKSMLYGHSVPGASPVLLSRMQSGAETSRVKSGVEMP